MRGVQKFSVALGIGCVIASLSTAGFASTATNTFSSSITIQANCTVASANSLGFGNQGVLTSNVDASATFAVQCTNTTAYTIGLDAGTTSGGSTTTRLMTDGSAHTVAYKIYQDTNHTSLWGNTIGTDTASGTGNGAQQTLTIYGRVAPQTTPQPGTYNDTVTITVTY